MIVEYLDDDPYTVLNLLLVSRIWYLTLTFGKSAEDHWKRRCNVIASQKRKTAGCKTWKETFFHMLHRRCIHCYSVTKKSIGHLLLVGYKFLKACNRCMGRHGFGPLSIVSQEDALEEYDITQYQLDRLPYRYEDEEAAEAYFAYDLSWREEKPKEEYLRAAIHQLICRMGARDLLIEGITSCVGKEDEAYLQMAFSWASSTNVKLLPCPTLFKLVKTYRSCGSEGKEDCKKALVDLMKHVCDAMLQIETELDELEEFTWPDPELSDVVLCEGSKIYWIDAIANKKLTPEDYIDAYRKLKAKREEEEEKELERAAEREERELDRLCGCGARNAIDCSYGLCYHCCKTSYRGECPRHGGRW